MLFADGPNACPFVALESDRDRRAAEPDPRHRCYAEPTPAPRALAHQREFCLSPDFGRCPIFQDWAVRAAARPVPLRPTGQPTEQLPAEPAEPAVAQQLPAFGALADEPAAPDRAAGAPAAPLAAPSIPPPAMAGGGSTADAGRSLDPQPIERLPSLPLHALAPETAEPVAAPPAEPSPPAEPELPAASEPAAAEPPRPRARPRWTDDWPPSAAPAGGATGTAAGGGAWLGASAARERAIEPEPEAAAPPPFLAGRRSQIEVGRPLPPARPSPGRRTSRRDEWSAQRADLIPPWERERYAAYPSLRTRIGLGDGDALLSRLTRILGIIAIGAVIIALLLLAPGFFAGGPGALPTASPSPSPSGPTASPSPTVTPEPTVSFATYVVRAGDSLSAIAVEFGLLPCQIQAANPEISDPNHIFIGQVLRIPPDTFGLDECAASSPAPS